MKNIMNVLKKSGLEIQQNCLLRRFNTFGIGGPADFLAIADTESDLIELIRCGKTAGIPIKILGGGSNVIISDKGYRGLVIINRDQHWQILDEVPDAAQITRQTSRFKIQDRRYASTEGLDYRDDQAEAVLVRSAAGLRVIPFMKTLYKNGITGLQWFAGIPASIGGAVFMNMHGARQFFGELVYRGRVFDGQQIHEKPHSWFAFDYDTSSLHGTDLCLLSVDLLLRRGDPEQARQLSKDWALSKSRQPQKSAGCIFHNLSADQQKKLRLPTPSVGYIIDKLLGLKGLQQGDAVISPRHAAFIENLGSAKAADVYWLYQKIQESAREQLGLDLVPEVEFIGEF